MLVNVVRLIIQSSGSKLKKGERGKCIGKPSMALGLVALHTITAPGPLLLKGTMKLSLLFFVSTTLVAQMAAPGNFVAFGVAYNSFSSPSVNVWANYTKNLKNSNTHPTFLLTSWDVSSKQIKPFVVQTSVRPGIAQTVFRAGPLTGLILGDLGVAAGGSNIGGAASTGGVGIIDLGGHLGHIHLVLVARALKSTLSDKQYVYEFGFGKSF